MKTFLNLVIIVLTTGILNTQESKTITGRIISEDLEPIPKAVIYNIDTIQLGTTDINGYFKIEVPVETRELLLGFIGMEWTLVRIVDNCQNLEMIMMVDIIYDFIPTRKINKKRNKRFNKLPKKYLQAYEQGIFNSSTPCVSYIFKKY